MYISVGSGTEAIPGEYIDVTADFAAIIPDLTTASPDFATVSPSFTTTSPDFAPITPSFTTMSPGFAPVTPDFTTGAPGFTSVGANSTGESLRILLDHTIDPNINPSKSNNKNNDRSSQQTHPARIADVVVGNLSDFCRRVGIHGGTRRKLIEQKPAREVVMGWMIYAASQDNLKNPKGFLISRILDGAPPPPDYLDLASISTDAILDHPDIIHAIRLFFGDSTSPIPLPDVPRGRRQWLSQGDGDDDTDTDAGQVADWPVMIDPAIHADSPIPRDIYRTWLAATTLWLDPATPHAAELICANEQTASRISSYQSDILHIVKQAYPLISKIKIT